MKATEPYNARQYEGDPPTIYCGDTVAFYHSNHECKTLREAEQICVMLNTAKRQGYSEARRHLGEWINQ